MNFINNIKSYYREYMLRNKIKQREEYISFLEKYNIFLHENSKRKEDILSTLYEINNKIKNHGNLLNHKPPKSVSNDVPDNVKCPVCLTNKCNTAFSCTHVICSECSEKITSCPICRETDISKKFYFNI